MDELQDVYAEQGVLRLQFGASEVFLLSSPEAVEEALCGKNLKASSSWDTGLRGIVETTWNVAKDGKGYKPSSMLRYFLWFEKGGKSPGICWPSKLAISALQWSVTRTLLIPAGPGGMLGPVRSGWLWWKSEKISIDFRWSQVLSLMISDDCWCSSQSSSFYLRLHKISHTLILSWHFHPTHPLYLQFYTSPTYPTSPTTEDWETMRRVLLREAFASSRVAQARPIIEAEATALVAQLTERLGTPVAARPVLRRSFTRFLLKWALSLEGEEVLKLEALVEEDRGLEIQFFEGQQVRFSVCCSSFFRCLFYYN